MTNDEIIKESKGKFKVAVKDDLLRHLESVSSGVAERSGFSVEKLAHKLEAIIIYDSNGKAHVIQQEVSDGEFGVSQRYDA